MSDPTKVSWTHVRSALADSIIIGAFLGVALFHAGKFIGTLIAMVVL